MLNLNSQLQTTNGLFFKNRVIVPAMASATSDEMGFPSVNTIEHYKRLSLSKASLVTVEYTYVHPYGRSEANQLGLYTMAHMQAVKEIATVIKNNGPLAAIQLVHGGAKSSLSLTKGHLIGPSSVIVPTKGELLERPRAATLNDIKKIKNAFLKAAIYATNAGFDIIELHAAHGYGLNQWISPITNRRQDIYGGSLSKRSRLLFELVEDILLQNPNTKLSVRMPGMDHFDGGLSLSDSMWLAKELENRGVTLLSISSGIGGWRRPEHKTGEGYLVDEAKKIQQQVQIPVVGVGGIQTASYINKALNNKNFALAAVGRAILNDSQWGSKIGLN